MFTEPMVEYREERHYAGIRTKTNMRDLGTVIPQLLDEVFARLGERGIEPEGAPIVRYHVIDMQGALDLEVGVPVASAPPDDRRVQPGLLPGGRYAALVYTGRQRRGGQRRAARLGSAAGYGVGHLCVTGWRRVRRALRVLPHRSG